MGEFVRRVRSGDAALAPQLEHLGLDQWARENLLRYIEDQHAAAGEVPSDTTLVIERTTDELGDWRIILHSPTGCRSMPRGPSL